MGENIDRIQRMADVKLNVLENYLVSRNWIKIDSKPNYVSYSNNDNKHTKKYTLLIPTNKAFEDYKERIYDVINLLSTFEDRTFNSVFNDIVIPTSDIIRISINDEKTIDGTIPFEDGLAALEGFKKAIIASAYSVEKPERYHKRTYSPEVDKFLSSCRLGQTEKGSFIATFFCPLDNTQLTLLGGEVEKFGRKATVNLMKSLNHIRKSIDEQQLNKIINPNESELIISGNLCDALLELKPSTNIFNIKFQVTWANNKKPDNVPSDVIFKNNDMSDIAYLLKKLKPQSEEFVNTFIGRVGQLKGEPKDNKMQGEVILILLDSEENYVRAKIYFDYTNYQKAIKFHANNANVSIKGKLVKESDRIHRIVNYSDFCELSKKEESE